MPRDSVRFPPSSRCAPRNTSPSRVTTVALGGSSAAAAFAASNVAAIQKNVNDYVAKFGSGGKALRGPQSSGFLFGRQDLVTSALLQQVDMDILSESWTPPKLIPARCVLRAPT